MAPRPRPPRQGRAARPGGGPGAEVPPEPRPPPQRSRRRPHACPSALPPPLQGSHSQAAPVAPARRSGSRGHSRALSPTPPRPRRFAHSPRVPLGGELPPPPRRTLFSSLSHPVPSGPAPRPPPRPSRRPPPRGLPQACPRRRPHPEAAAAPGETSGSSEGRPARAPGAACRRGPLAAPPSPAPRRPWPRCPAHPAAPHAPGPQGRGRAGGRGQRRNCAEQWDSASGLGAGPERADACALPPPSEDVRNCSARRWPALKARLRGAPPPSGWRSGAAFELGRRDSPSPLPFVPIELQMWLVCLRTRILNCI